MLDGTRVGTGGLGEDKCLKQRSKVVNTGLLACRSKLSASSKHQKGLADHSPNHAQAVGLNVPAKFDLKNACWPFGALWCGLFCLLLDHTRVDKVHPNDDRYGHCKAQSRDYRAQLHYYSTSTLAWQHTEDRRPLRDATALGRNPPRILRPDSGSLTCPLARQKLPSCCHPRQDSRLNLPHSALSHSLTEALLPVPL